MGRVNLANPDLQYRGKNSIPIPPDYEPGVLGPSEWWFKFWCGVKRRDAKRAATVKAPQGTT